MGAAIPYIDQGQFNDQILRLSPVPCSSRCLRSLYAHYSELRRWSPRLSLVGPGTTEVMLGRHYAESLAALPLISDKDRVLVDVGTGAGFPGLVLAAAKESLEVTLVESRERKWAFLKSAVRRSGLSCGCLNARVGETLPWESPCEIDIVTCRALSLPPILFDTLQEASPGVRFLLWCGVEYPMPAKGYRVARQVPLPGSRHRRILEIVSR